MQNNKTCTECDIEKPLGEFHNQKAGKYGKTSYCKKCISQKGREYRQKHPEEIKKRKKIQYEAIGRQKRGSESMYKNKNCSQYLGIVIAEHLVRHLFNNVKIMPHGNPKFDFICNKGMKIDVKSGCTQLNKGKYPRWEFRIEKNKIADYFICVAFDNRVELNPFYLWMIPGKEINHLVGARISLSTIHKWDKWKMNIEDARICCNEIKKENK